MHSRAPKHAVTPRVPRVLRAGRPEGLRSAAHPFMSGQPLQISADLVPVEPVFAVPLGEETGAQPESVSAKARTRARVRTGTWTRARTQLHAQTHTRTLTEHVTHS